MQFVIPLKVAFLAKSYVTAREINQTNAIVKIKIYTCALEQMAEWDL